MFTFSYRVNEGMHIESNGISIDVIVVAKGGSRIGEVCLEVLGLEGIDKMCLTPSEKLVHLGGDIYLGILRRERPNGRTNLDIIKNINYDKQSNDKVKITWDIPREFKWQCRRYD